MNTLDRIMPGLQETFERIVCQAAAKRAACCGCRPFPFQGVDHRQIARGAPDVYTAIEGVAVGQMHAAEIRRDWFVVADHHQQRYYHSY